MSWKILNQFKVTKEIGKFTDVLKIAVTDLKEAKCEDALSKGTFFLQVMCIIRQDVCSVPLIFKPKKDENVENLLFKELNSKW